MTRRKLAALVSAGMSALVLIITSGAAHAATPSNNPVNGNGNAIRISPVRSDLTIAPGSSSTISVFVQNVTNAPATFQPIANDFIADSDESGTPKLLLDGNAAAPTHGLKQFMDVGSDLTLQPQEQKEIRVKISIPANAAGGGYYGAVRILPTSGIKSQLSLSPSVASLVLVTVPGDIKEQLGISSFNVSNKNGRATNFFTNAKTLQVVTRFNNFGNVQVAPFGKVVLKKSGKTLASAELNNVTPRGVVLPGTIRRFTTDFSNKATTFGKYSIESTLGYGTKGQSLYANTSFYVVPLSYVIVGIVLVIAIIIGIIILPRMLKTHDRKLLKKMRGRK